MDLVAFFSWFSAWSQSLAESFGYFGIFFVSFIGSATIIFPIPSFIVVFTFGALLNPWLVGVAAALGAAVGELTGYGIGLAGEKAMQKKHEYWLKKANKWMEKYDAFLVIAFFAATPLPDDVLGIFCGAIKYDVRKFFAASLSGKLVMNISLALGGYYGMQWVLSVFGGA